MLFKKTYDELVSQSIEDLSYNTNITNMNAGGTARTLLEVINSRTSELYETLDINTAMGFLSSADGYFLDLIGELFNISRLTASYASVDATDSVQKFYVSSGFLGDKIPSLSILAGTTVNSVDGSIVYTTVNNAVFSAGAKEVYVSTTANESGEVDNVGRNILVVHDIDVAGVYTTNEQSIVSGTDTESDGNYRYRIANATLTAERANETAVRLAALSVDGVANIVMIPYSRGIGSYDVMVVPSEGLPTTTLVANVQTAIDSVQAYGIRGIALSPTIVPVDLDIRLVFVDDVTEERQETIKKNVKIAVEQYITNIPLGGEFILNELRQQIMDVSGLIKDHVIHCYYFREEPHMLGNITIERDEMFYPNPNSAEAIRVN